MLTRLSIVIVAAILATAGCTKKKADYNLDLGETLRVNINTEPPSLDWTKSTDMTSALVQENLMQGLTEFNLSDPELSVEPALATEWSASADAKTWTFTLRSGVKWTDGVELTTQHVLDGWERLLNPATASQYAYFLYGIKNARKYNEGKTKDFAEVGVKVNDKGQIVVELEGPLSYFPHLLTHHSTYPVRKDVIAKHGDKWTEPGNIVTLGAYTLKIWDHDKAIVLERNENYYGEKAVTKYVLCYMINEASTALNLFEAGKVDALTSVPSTELSRLKSRPEYQQNKILSLYYYGLNVSKKPLDNPLVRKAFAHAIDRAEITKMLAGGQTPMSSWVPPGMLGHEVDRGLTFDADKAKKFLDEAGFSDRSKFPKLTLAFNTNEDHQRIAENIQAQLKRNLGVEIELKNMEWKTYLAALRSDTPDIYRLGWVADYPDPDNFFSLMASYSENNHTKWKNKDFDGLVELGARELSKDERKRVYSKAHALLTEAEVPVLPIYSGVSHRMIAKRVKNFPANPMDRNAFRKVQLQ